MGENFPKDEKESTEPTYDQVLYERLKSYAGKHCLIRLKNGTEAKGRLDYVGMSVISRKPFIVFDIGESRVAHDFKDINNIERVELA